MSTSAAANKDDSPRARAAIRDIYAAALRAVDPGRAVEQSLARGDVGHTKLAGRRVHLIGAGKAAPHMAVGALRQLGGSVCGGILATPGRAGSLGPVAVIPGGHPLPDEHSIAAGQALARYVARIDPDDAVLILLSGGASAALELPIPGVTLPVLREVTSHLLEDGADIQTLNLVRRGLSLLKGGGLLRHLPTRHVLTLAISDVVGDDPRTIGSGPSVHAPIDSAAVVAALRAHDLPTTVVDAVTLAMEQAPELASPGPGSVYELVATATDAVRAAASAAQQRGFVTRVREGVTGEARVVGRALGAEMAGVAAGDPTCRLVSGETTVVVQGKGRGGRNQEVALAAAIEMDGIAGVCLAAIATDGVDGVTPAAGAIVDGSTLARGAQRGLDAHGFLAANDSYTFFAGLGDLVMTGPTGTNVMDLHIAITMGRP